MEKNALIRTAMVDRWYKDGVRFKCTQCGKCCTGSPGYVWITEAEVANMARALNISPDLFKRKYTRHSMGRLALIENRVTYDCVFLKDKKCEVYDSRPKQCRKFPWWSDILKSKESWEEEGSRCEGINHPEAPLISAEEIEKAWKKE